MGANESSDKAKSKFTDNLNDLKQDNTTTSSQTNNPADNDKLLLNIVVDKSTEQNTGVVDILENKTNQNINSEKDLSLSMPEASPPLTPTSSANVSVKPPAYPSEKRRSTGKKNSPKPPPIPDDSSDDDLPPIPETSPYVFSNSNSPMKRASMKGRLSERFSGLGDELKNANLSLGSNIHLRQSRASFSHDIIVDSAFNQLVKSDSNGLNRSGSNSRNSSGKNVNSARSPELSKNMSSSSSNNINDNVDNTIFYRDRNQSFSLAIGSYIKPVPIKPLEIEEYKKILL